MQGGRQVARFLSRQIVRKDVGIVQRVRRQVCRKQVCTKVDRLGMQISRYVGRYEGRQIRQICRKEVRQIEYIGRQVGGYESMYKGRTQVERRQVGFSNSQNHLVFSINILKVSKITYNGKERKLLINKKDMTLKTDLRLMKLKVRILSTN